MFYKTTVPGLSIFDVAHYFSVHYSNAVKLDEKYIFSV